MAINEHENESGLLRSVKDLDESVIGLKAKDGDGTDGDETDGDGTDGDGTDGDGTDGDGTDGDGAEGDGTDGDSGGTKKSL